MFPGAFGRLLDRVGDFVRATIANADLSGAITDDGNRSERETTTALNYLGASIDENDFFEEAGIILILVTIIPAGATMPPVSAMTAGAAGWTRAVIGRGGGRGGRNVAGG